jgi:hypothetical protein
LPAQYIYPYLIIYKVLYPAPLSALFYLLTDTLTDTLTDILTDTQMNILTVIWTTLIMSLMATLLRLFSLPLINLLLFAVNTTQALGNGSLCNLSYNRWLIHYTAFNGVFKPLYLLRLGQKRVKRL